MKLLSFIKIIRVAKVVETSRVISSKKFKSIYEKEDFNKIKDPLIHLVGRRKNIIIKTNNEEEKHREIVKLSMRYTLENIQEGVRNKLKDFDTLKKNKNVKKNFTREPSEVPLKTDIDDKINEANYFKNNAEIIDELYLENEINKGELSFGKSNESKSDKMDEEEENALNNKIKNNIIIQRKLSGANFDSKFQNKVHEENDKTSFNYKIQLNLTKVICSDRFNQQDVNLESPRKKLLEKEINLEKKEILGLEDIKENNNSIQSDDSDESLNMANELKTDFILKSSNKFELSKNLSESVIHHVVIVIMSILIALPIFDLDFVKQFVYDAAKLTNQQQYCLNSLNRFINASIIDPTYLKGLNITINNCIFPDKLNLNNSKILNFNFSESVNYGLLENNYTFIQLPDFIESGDSKSFLEKYRLVNDYFNVSSGGIISTVSQVDLCQISALLSIVKSFFVGIVLIYTSNFLNKDFTNLVILPYNHIFKRLKFFLKDFDQNTDMVEDNIEELRDININKKKDKIHELCYIEKTLTKFMHLITISMGYPSKIASLLLSAEDYTSK